MHANISYHTWHIIDTQYLFIPIYWSSCYLPITFLRVKLPQCTCCSAQSHQPVILCWWKSPGPYDSQRWKSPGVPVHLSSLDLPSHSGAYHNYFGAFPLPTRTWCAFVPHVHLSVSRRKLIGPTKSKIVKWLICIEHL